MGIKFKAGDKKIPNSGRKKGTPNKNTLRWSEGLLERGFNVLDEFVRLYGEADTEGQITLLGKAIEYSFAKPKPIDQNGDDSERKTIEVIISELNKED